MIHRLFHQIHLSERALARRFGNRIDTPGTRLASLVHFHLMDHMSLRLLWSNFDQVAPGIYRCSHPNHRRLRRAKALGVRIILNLRGEGQKAHYLFERESCKQLGLRLVSRAFSARHAPDRDALLELIALMRGFDAPFLLHCKSGADRAGFVSAVALLTLRDAPLQVARRQLSLRYLHLRHTQTGIMDHVLDLYAPYAAQMGFEAWLNTHYDAAAATESFRARRLRRPNAPPKRRAP